MRGDWPLAQRGQWSGLNKDMLNKGRLPKNRRAPTPGPVRFGRYPQRYFLDSAGIGMFLSVLPTACPRWWPGFPKVDLVAHTREYWRSAETCWVVVLRRRAADDCCVVRGDGVRSESPRQWYSPSCFFHCPSRR